MPTATVTSGLAIGTRRTDHGTAGYTYTGILRHHGHIVAECGHEHTNRDVTSGANGRSAADCARDILAGAYNAHTADHNADVFRNRWVNLTRGGFVASKTTIELAKVSAAQAADTYEAAVATTRAFLTQQPTAAPTPTVPNETPTIGDLPEWML